MKTVLQISLIAAMLLPFTIGLLILFREIVLSWFEFWTRKPKIQEENLVTSARNLIMPAAIVKEDSLNSKKQTDLYINEQVREGLIHVIDKAKSSGVLAAKLVILVDSCELDFSEIVEEFKLMGYNVECLKHTIYISWSSTIDWSEIPSDIFTQTLSLQSLHTMV